MKLNHDCIRDLLLLIEENLTYGHYIDPAQLELKNYSVEELTYTAEKLDEAGFIQCNISKFLSNPLPAIRINSMTYYGHQLLDNIRDDGVWKETKKLTSKISSASIKILSEVAAQVISNIISKQMGLPN